MPRLCPSCEYHDNAPRLGACPACGEPLEFTCLTPSGGIEAGPIRFDPERWRQHVADYLHLTNSLAKTRWAQILVALSLQCALLRYVVPLPQLWNLDVLRHADLRDIVGFMGPEKTAAYAAIAVVAGFVAGAWALSWLRQGLFVALAFVVSIALKLFLFCWYEEFGVPAHYWTTVGQLAILGAMTAVPTVLGAFLGHCVIRPLRVPVANLAIPTHR